MAEVYVSTDVEADGPIPGPHSMLSFASAAYRADKTLVGTFAANLTTLPGARATRRRWPGGKASPRPGPPAGRARDPAEVMPEYVAWLKALPGKPVFVGYPAAYDFLFVYWYLIRFAGESPFSHSALDIKTYAMALLGTEYRDVDQATCPRTGSTTCRTPTSPWTTPGGRGPCSATCWRRGRPTLGWAGREAEAGIPAAPGGPRRACYCLIPRRAATRPRAHLRTGAGRDPIGRGRPPRRDADRR